MKGEGCWQNRLIALRRVNCEKGTSLKISTGGEWEFVLKVVFGFGPRYVFDIVWKGQKFGALCLRREIGTSLNN